MLYLAIPAHNEVATIGVLLWRLRTVLAEFPREYEVVVYDDASTDDTAAVAEQYERAMPVTVIRGTTRLGYAGATDALLRHVAGMTRYPRRDAVLLLQGDFTDPPGIIPEFARRFDGGADLVVGERRTVADAPTPVRRLFRAGQWVMRPFIRVDGVRDLTASMRLIRISVLRDAIRTADEEALLRGDSWTANADLLLRLVPHARRVEAVTMEPTFGVRMRETRRMALRDAMALLKWSWGSRGRRAIAGSATEAGGDADRRTGRSSRRPDRGSERGSERSGDRRQEPELDIERLRERVRETGRDAGARRDGVDGAREDRGRRGRDRDGRRERGGRSDSDRETTRETTRESGRDASRADRAPRAERKERPARPPRAERPERSERPPRPERTPRSERHPPKPDLRATVDEETPLDDPFAAPVARRREPPVSEARRDDAPPDNVADNAVSNASAEHSAPEGPTAEGGSAEGASGQSDEAPGGEKSPRRRNRRSRRGRRRRNGEPSLEGSGADDAEATGRDANWPDADGPDTDGPNTEGADADGPDTGADTDGPVDEGGDPSRPRRRGRRGRRGGARRSRGQRDQDAGRDGRSDDREAADPFAPPPPPPDPFA